MACRAVTGRLELAQTNDAGNPLTFFVFGLFKRFAAKDRTKTFAVTGNRGFADDWLDPRFSEQFDVDPVGQGARLVDEEDGRAGPLAYAGADRLLRQDRLVVAVMDLARP